MRWINDEGAKVQCRTCFIRTAQVIILTIFPHQKNGLQYLLLILFFSLGCWLLPRSGFIRNSGLSSNTIRLLFLLKVSAGFALGWISLHYYGHKPSDNDYWKMNKEGWDEYQLLVNHPKVWLTNLFSSPYETGYSGFFNSVQSFWNDLRNNLVLKLVSVFNIFSRGDYYINSLFMNFIGFFGHIAIFRFFSNIYKERKTALVIGCFLLPSMLYFSSGLHKDAVIFTALAFFLFAFQRAFSGKKNGLKGWLVITISLLLILLIRSYVVMLLIPACAGFYLCKNNKWPYWLNYGIVYIITGILFFSIPKMIPGIDPPATVVKKQRDFATTGFAKTAVPLDTLEANFTSFTMNTPQALNHSLLRPYIFEHPGNFIIPMAVELFLYQLFFLLFLCFRVKEPAGTDPLVILLFLFSLTALVNIGYIVNNLGTIVRYRSLYLPFLISPVLALTDWRKLLRLLNIKK